jgi:hypothetical protein
LRRSANILISDQELQALKKEGSAMSIPKSQTPWQELYRRTVNTGLASILPWIFFALSNAAGNRGIRIEGP